MRIIEHIKEKKKQYIIGITIGTLSVSLLWLNIRNNSFAISVNEQVVTIVKTKEEAVAAYQTLVDSIKQNKGVDIAVNEEIGVEPVHSKTKEIQSGQEVMDAINKAITYGVEAFEIIVEGKTHAIVQTEEIALDVLAQIAKSHLADGAEVVLDSKNIKEETKENIEEPEQKQDVETGEEEITTQIPTALAGSNEGVNQTTEESEGIEGTTPDATTIPTEGKMEVIKVTDALPKEEVKNEIKVESVEMDKVVEEKKEEPKEGQKIERELKAFDFNEAVTIKNIYVNEKEILTSEQATNILLGDEAQIVEYELQEGDNIWDIAVKHETTMDHILEINPQITDEKKMQIGEVIKLEVPDPILSISTVEQATFKELIPSEIEYVEFSDLYKDETKTYQEGHDGLKEITVNVHKVNGKEVSRELVSEKKLKEPKTKVIAFGTKEKPKPKPTQSSTSNKNQGTSSVKPSNSGQFMHPLNGGGEDIL